MATAKDRITPKPAPKNNEAEGAMTLRVSPPVVKVGSPQVTVKVASPQLNMDSKAFGDAINQLAQGLAQVAQQQGQILQAIQALASREVKVEVKPADVKLPASKRPRSFYVELDKDDGETVGMRISADTLN